MNLHGIVSKHKEMLVVIGFLQKYDIGYNEDLVDIARLETVRLVMTITSGRKWSIYQLHVKYIFGNGSLEKNFFLTQPSNFEVKGKYHMVYNLLKALYGLKKEPRV